jgi:X-X-X-Leu-X-X-Gly heptad repeat protein
MVAGVVAGAEKAVAGAGKAAAGAGAVAAGAEKVAAQQYPQWQWRAAFAGVAVTVVVFVIAIVHSCSVPLASLPDLDPAQGLPELVRSAASCQRADTSTSAQRCVIRVDHPILAGGITGGRELTLSVALDSPDRLSDTISRWRTAGATVLSDGPVFVAIGPSATVWYANISAGLRIETGSFTGRAAAQTFLSRSGLTR